MSERETSRRGDAKKLEHPQQPVNHAEARYYGKYRGRVTDNGDPELRGRVRVVVPAVHGERETAWALPAFAYGGAANEGLFLVPEPGADVWVEFEGGDPDLPIWTGGWFSAGEAPEGGRPGRKALRTRSGHRIVLDDDALTVEIEDANGNRVRLEASGVTIQAAAKVTVSASIVELNAGEILINAGLTHVSGVLQADTVIANSVVGSSYTPGVGNLV